MVWFEIVTNPTLKILDLEGIVALVKVKAPDALLCVDNTFLSPYLLVRYKSVYFGYWPNMEIDNMYLYRNIPRVNTILK